MMNKRMFLGTATAVALFVAGFAAPAFAGDPDAALKELMTQVNSKGPNGEDPALASSVTLTDDELAKIKALLLLWCFTLVVMTGPTPRPQL
jgi:ribose transport system substrate-binding protein